MAVSGEYHTFEILPKAQVEQLRAEEPESYGAYMAFLAVEALRQRDEIRDGRKEAKLHPLTREFGVLHKIAMDEELEALEARLQTFTMRATDPNAVVLIFSDADHFKTEINGRYGQRVGDEAIKELARAHVEAVRGHDDLVSCDGGDEFLIALLLREDGISPEEVAELVIERDHQNCQAIGAERKAKGGLPYDLTNTYGVAVWRPGDGISILDAKEEANLRMIANKPDSGRR